ncbi:MAG: iron-containing alcohol dehydrogenase [Lachnospiraceae bacterium]|nr:iron-containing alcohol dehydrogenase [Lachnospiraceae bacterium]MDY6222132.1 iron-containing alcohol dehydrogenase [Candidatus Alectryocaccobium sp.]
MKEFKTYTNIAFADSFADFIETEKIGEGDFVLTNEFLYDKYIAPLGLPCGTAFLEKYALGEPSTDMVDAIRKDLPAGIRRMIAIGGGAVMDTAKMLSLTTSKGTTESLFDLSPDAEKPVRIFDVYAVPTTCGTGSEVTNACAVELVSLHTKRGLNNDLLFPKKSFIIPELLYGLPYKFFATSSIDALIHAAESYLSPKATPVSELFSVQAIRMIMEGYIYIVENGLEKWTDKAGDFMTAATFAGLAFCSAGCAAVHALSYPLGGKYHIPHGESNQLVFAATFRKYKEKQPVGKLNRFEALLAEILKVSEDEALDKAFELFDKVQPRKPLHEFGIKEDELREFAQGVIKGQQRLLSNSYVQLSEDEMVEIYKSVF